MYSVRTSRTFHKELISTVPYDTHLTVFCIVLDDRAELAGVDAQAVSQRDPSGRDGAGQNHPGSQPTSIQTLNLGAIFFIVNDRS
jgi:hypothetical protein